MKINEIKELLKVIDQTNLGFVKIEINELKLEVSKSNNDTISVYSKNNDVKDFSSEIIIDKEHESENFKEENSNQHLHLITAPLMGTFYASSGPDEDSFVNVGDTVKQGETLCILEAMKLMNEITSDIEGEIVEVLVKNEELVEYGKPLFKIKPL